MTIGMPNVGDWIGWARQGIGSWFSGAMPAEHADRRVPMMPSDEEKLKAGVRVPQFLPYYDQLQNLAETAEQRLAYRVMLADPNVKAAVSGKVFGVMSLELNCQAADDSDRSKEIAEFVEWALTRRINGGIPELAWNILIGALIDGYSVNEKVTEIQERGRWAGKRVVSALKPKDVDQDLVPLVDEFKNITGIMGLRYNAGQIFSRREFLIHAHLPMWGNVTGTSDFRAAYGRYWMSDTVMKLRAMGAERRYMPITVGEYGDVSQQTLLTKALAGLKYRNWLAVPKDVKIQVIDIAGSSETFFSNFRKDLQEEIFLAIALATLQALVGGEGQQRGSSAVHADTAARAMAQLAKALSAVMNDPKWGLVCDLVDWNYIAVGDYPYVSLVGLDDADLQDSLTIDEGLFEMKVPLSLADIYERYGRKAPKNEKDSLVQQDTGGGGPGAGDMPGALGKDPGGLDLAPEQPKLPEQPGEHEEEFAEFAASDWRSETGERGGHRWINKKTGKKVYAKDNPGGAEREKKTNPDAGGKKRAVRVPPAAQQPAKSKGKAQPPKVAPKKKAAVGDVAKRIKGMMGQQLKPEDVQDLADTLLSMSPQELKQLKGELGTKGAKAQPKAKPEAPPAAPKAAAPKGKSKASGPEHVAQAADAYRSLLANHKHMDFDHATAAVSALVSTLSVDDAKALAKEVGINTRQASRKAVAETLTRRIHERKATDQRNSFRPG
jgi:Protein of unknown function (DUF935)